MQDKPEHVEVTVEVARIGHREPLLPLPVYQTSQSAGMDLLADLEASLVLAPGDRTLVPTGLTMAIPSGYEGQIRPRSGLALRHGLLVPNAPGTIDSDYRGEIKVILMNGGSEPVTLERGMRIAQLVVAPVTRAVLREVEALDSTERGSGGFGHTGI